MTPTVGMSSLTSKRGEGTNKKERKTRAIPSNWDYKTEDEARRGEPQGKN